MKIQKIDDSIEFLFDPKSSLYKIIVTRPNAHYYRPTHIINIGSHNFTPIELNSFYDALKLAKMIVVFEKPYFDEEGNRKIFPQSKNVHTEHCCIIHGCKYGKADCPVASSILPQSFLCESCDDYYQENNCYQKQIFEIAKSLFIS